MEADRAAAAAVEKLGAGARLAEVFIEDRRVVELSAGSQGTRRSERRRRGACLRRVDAAGATSALHIDDPSEEDLTGAARELARGGWPSPARGRPLDLAHAALPDREVAGLEAWLSETRDLLGGLHPSAVSGAVRSRQAVIVASEMGEVRRDRRDALRVHATLPGPGGAVQWTAAAEDLDDLRARVSPAVVGEELGRRLTVAREAVPAPVGRFPAVLAPEAAALLVHEALAHPAEADAPGSWIEVGAELPAALTLLDEPGRARGAGAYRVDDEGEDGRRVVLLEGGELAGRLRDRLSAAQAGQKPTGHGRRQSYRDLPQPRLACTALEPGGHRPADLIESVVRGLLVERIASGTVDPASGSLCLFAESARLIEGGRPGLPVRGLVLHGRAPDWMGALDGVGDDLRFDGGATACSKGGQTVPVVVGSPTLLFSSVPAGGVER